MIKQHQSLTLWGKCIFERAVFEPPFRLMAKMPNEACFYYVKGGQAKIYAADETLIMERSEGIVLQCGNFLNEYLAQNDAGTCEAIAVHFHPEVLKMLYDRDLPEFLGGLSRVKAIEHTKVKADTQLDSYIESLLFYFDQPDLVSEALLQLKLKEIILLLAKTNNAVVIRDLITRLFSVAEADLKAVVEANVYNRLSLEELAALANRSLSSFKRDFAQTYGTSPGKYIREKRLERAATLLHSTSRRITDIAFDTGFVDMAHFSRAFVAIYGTAPSKYRLNE